MKRNRILFLISIFLFLAGGLSQVHAKVDPANYNFSLDSLKPFLPGTGLNEMEKKVGKGEKVGAGLFRYYVAQLRYKFPVYVQVKQGKSVNFLARLPSYFLHDIFHQTLINRYGPQDLYSKKDNGAIYIWKNIKGVRHIYSGQCNITCHPIYYSTEGVSPETGKGSFKPLLEQMVNQASLLGKPFEAE